MCYYKHLTSFERERTLFFLIGGKSITEIARLLNLSKFIISRDIRRNSAPNSQLLLYLPLEAQTFYTQRQESCRPHKHFCNASSRSYIKICILEFHWSAEEIAEYIQLEYDPSIISVPTI